MSGKIFDWVMHKTDLFSEPIPGTTLVEIAGNKRVLIENHKGVTSYNTDSIHVTSTNGSLIVSGNELLIASMSKQQLVITGCISCVSLCKEP